MERNIVNIVGAVFLLVGLALFAFSGSAFLRHEQGSWIPVLLGLAFALVGGGILGYGIAAKRRRAWLLANGRPVPAIFDHVEVNTTVAVNDKHPFRIVGHWHDHTRNELHVFRSANLWVDPSPFVTDGQSLRVLVDPGKPSRYHMDISFLPKVRG
ncbi:hypothetical protein [Luteimonas lutimaris]|uniref:DUF3592 domain-containing protein n=1 Tax=Luteimonas lutimaris TaxID=698645 RepID=A0ABP7M6D8_9GAMM